MYDRLTRQDVEKMEKELEHRKSCRREGSLGRRQGGEKRREISARTLNIKQPRK